MKYSFNNIQVVDGRVDFHDGPKGAHHRIAGIQLSVPFVSNLKYHVNRYITPSFAAIVNGDAVSLKGWSKPFKESLETTFEIVVSDLDLPRYLEYLPFRREYDVPSARLDVKTYLRFLQREGGAPAIRLDGYAQLRDVRVTGKDNSPMILLPQVRAVLSPADIGAGEYRLASLAIRDPEIDVAIDRNGKLNLLSLMPEKEKGNPVDEDERKTAEADAEGGKRACSPSTRCVFPAGRSASRTHRGRGFQDGAGDIGSRGSVEHGAGKGRKASLSLSTDAGESFGLKGTLTLAPAGSRHRHDREAFAR